MSTLTTIAAGDQITNSRAVINSNFSALNTDKIETSIIDTDTALTANSDAKIPSQKAVKAYADAVITASATDTTKGIVEIGTQAEVNAGTATGATGASLAVTPATLKGMTTPVVRTYLNAASPATWTKPTGLRYVVVEVQAVGGNGGQATNNPGRGGGGSGGGYSKKLIAAASLGATETVTIGAATASSSFGAHCSATAGTTGTDDNAGAVVTGGTGTGGDINITGGSSHPNQTTGFSGSGGSSMLGTGAPSQGANNVAGINGIGYGSGGSGGNTSNTTDMAGGTAGPAIVIVTEYYV